jgi:hypothetical protein
MTKALDNLPLLEDEEEDDRDFPEEVDFKDSCLEILKSIGTEDFKNNWSIFSNKIFSSNIKSQILFCKDLLTKIDEVYDFVPLTVKLDSIEDLKKLYDFVVFLEYNHLSLLSELFYFLEIPVNKVLDYKILFSTLWTKISQFLDQFKSENEIVTEFLRTYMKENFVNYLEKVVEKEKTEISIILAMKTLKGEKDGKQEVISKD